jgi:hypothetical protein
MFWIIDFSRRKIRKLKPESKCFFSNSEMTFENSKFMEIIIKEVPGKEFLDVQHLKKFRKIIELYRDETVRK